MTQIERNLMEVAEKALLEAGKNGINPDIALIVALLTAIMVKLEVKL